MKKVIFVFLILHFFLITANAQWVVVSDTSFNNAVEVFADNGTFLYAAIPGLGLYKTSDLGQSWYSSFFHIDDRVANCLAVKDSLVFIANDSGLYKSTNYGDNWIKLNLGPNCLYASSVIFKNNYLFAGTYFGIKRSTDLGANWILINNEINWSYGNIQYFTFSNNILYVAIDFSYNLKIFKSTNFGENWSDISQGINSNNIPYSLYTKDNLLLCGTAEGVYKSTNYGSNWSLIPSIPGNIGLFGFASIGTQHIFISAWNYGVYVSNNYGETFSLRNEGLQSYRCTSLYNFGDYLYLGTNPITLPCKIYRRSVSEVVSVKNISSEIPKEYKLYQNYPNPFNPSTNIKYQLTRHSGSSTDIKFITLKVYNLLGKEIATLVNEKQSPGTYEISFDAGNLSTGIYFYTLEVDGKRIDMKKMVLLK